MAIRVEDRVQTDREFIITRVLDAPRSTVFYAWTDPVQMAKWWGPHSVTNVVSDMDVRPGGSYRIVRRGPDGTEYPLKGTHREIKPPAQLVMTMDASEHPKEWHDLVMPHHSQSEKNPCGLMLDTITFEDLGSARLIVRTRFESPEIRDAMLKMNERRLGSGLNAREVVHPLEPPPLEHLLQRKLGDSDPSWTMSYLKESPPEPVLRSRLNTR
jgi:uncharacterized protein YndB with AHSA1/START domain